MSRGCVRKKSPYNVQGSGRATGGVGEGCAAVGRENEPFAGEQGNRQGIAKEQGRYREGAGNVSRRRT